MEKFVNKLQGYVEEYLCQEHITSPYYANQGSVDTLHDLNKLLNAKNIGVRRNRSNNANRNENTSLLAL